MNIDDVYELICKLTFKEKYTLYKRLQNQIEDEQLFLEAEKRMKNITDSDFISSDDVILHLGIKKDELNKIEVDIE